MRKVALRKKLCAPGAAAAVLAVLSVVTASAQGPPAMPAKPIVAAAVIERPLNIGETFVGTVMPVRRSTVGSQVEGRVEEFLVNEGDYVTAGQPMARLRTTTLDLQMKAAQAELQVRQAELSEMEKSAPKEIEQVKARMESAEAQVVFNDKRMKRFQELYEKRALSDDELEEQIYAAESAKKTYAEARSAWELATSGIWDAKIAQAKASVEVQQETINQLADDIQQHTIAAPYDGYITREDTEVGQWVTKGGDIVEIVEVDRVDVEVAVLERYEPQLRIGSDARVEFEAMPGRDWTGKVVLIVPQADIRSRSFPVKVRLENETVDSSSGREGVVLKPGMFARVTLPVGQRDAVTMVPKDALVLGTGRPVVWVITPDPSKAGEGTATPVSVELGLAYDEMIEVHGPLKAGQLVVIEGNERIQPGEPLAITRKD